jgi:hypothetical protein
VIPQKGSHRWIEGVWDTPSGIDGLLDVIRQESWRDFALCAQTDPDSFYPEKGGRTKDAKATCKRCPVIAECREYALEADERDGIWGGMTPRARRRIVRERRMREPAEPRVVPASLTHGRTGYRRGCRCNTCFQAERRYQHERYIRRRAAS